MHQWWVGRLEVRQLLECQWPVIHITTTPCQDDNYRHWHFCLIVECPIEVLPRPVRLLAEMAGDEMVKVEVMPTTRSMN